MMYSSALNVFFFFFGVGLRPSTNLVSRPSKVSKITSIESSTKQDTLTWRSQNELSLSAVYGHYPFSKLDSVKTALNIFGEKNTEHHLTLMNLLERVMST